MIRVFITDDHQLVVDGISSILEGHDTITVAGTALSGQETLDQLRDLEVDVLLLDINMPGIDGIEVANRLKEEGSPVKILTLTMHNNPQFTKQLIEMGVLGCIMKNSGKKQVIEAITQVYQGHRHYAQDVTTALFDSIDKSKKAAEKVELTKREIEILKLISQGLTTQEIADSLFISHHTVETHRKNLISKTGVRNVAELVRFAVKNHLDE